MLKVIDKILSNFRKHGFSVGVERKVCSWDWLTFNVTKG
jgi:hypothetical protein